MNLTPRHRGLARAILLVALTMGIGTGFFILRQHVSQQRLLPKIWASPLAPIQLNIHRLSKTIVGFSDSHVKAAFQGLDPDVANAFEAVVSGHFADEDVTFDIQSVASQGVPRIRLFPSKFDLQIKARAFAFDVEFTNAPNGSMWVRLIPDARLEPGEMFMCSYAAPRDWRFLVAQRSGKWQIIETYLADLYGAWILQESNQP